MASSFRSQLSPGGKSRELRLLCGVPLQVCNSLKMCSHCSALSQPEPQTLRMYLKKGGRRGGGKGQQDTPQVKLLPDTTSQGKCEPWWPLAEGHSGGVHHRERTEHTLSEGAQASRHAVSVLRRATWGLSENELVCCAPRNTNWVSYHPQVSKCSFSPLKNVQSRGWQAGPGLNPPITSRVKRVKAPSFPQVTKQVVRGLSYRSELATPSSPIPKTPLPTPGKGPAGCWAQ